MKWILYLRVSLLCLTLLYVLLLLYRALQANLSPPTVVYSVAPKVTSAASTVARTGSNGTTIPMVSDIIHSSSDIATAVVLQAAEESTKYAYVSLLHGIDTSFAYRGFLYHAILVKKALEQLGSEMDFVLLVGFSSGEISQDSAVQADLSLLRQHKIKLFFLPRLEEDLQGQQRKKKVSFMEMALLKITPWSFSQYKRVQFLDGDVLPHKNMDCLFELDRNSFNTGSASPLNSGWYLGIPNMKDYEEMKVLAVNRARTKWNEKLGWGKEVPTDLWYRGRGRTVKKWDFNGASLDQGLLTHHFVLTHGRVQLFDFKDAELYDENYIHQSREIHELSPRCLSILPTDRFYHYTGRNKPWLQDLDHPKDKSIKYWKTQLDRAGLTLNSTFFQSTKLKSPLGYFHPNT